MPEDPEAYFKDILRILGKDVSVHARFLAEPQLEIFADIGKLSARILYDDRSILSILLAVDFSSGYPDWTHYSFHYRDSGSQCRFRYDNTPHYASLPQFPHHKHEGPKERVIPCSKPSVHQIQGEIIDLIRLHE